MNQPKLTRMVPDSRRNRWPSQYDHRGRYKCRRPSSLVPALLIVVPLLVLARVVL